ncbi:serine--tRNA ligase, partial [bacterium]|nr:serine--tRNA ligase [bacterium]
LELPYRVVRLAAAELSFASEKTYDLEVWAPGSQRWLEVSSVSSFGTFQARRLNLRYRSAVNGNVHFLHTLNGSGIALPRTIAALLEHYQTDEKTIHVPAVLQPYLGTSVIR